MKANAALTMAIVWLRKAIDRHERHMNGKEPTDEESQLTMMDEMKAALGHLRKLRDGDTE